jgi:cell division septation protein DedD
MDPHVSREAYEPLECHEPPARAGAPRRLLARLLGCGVAVAMAGGTWAACRGPARRPDAGPDPISDLVERANRELRAIQPQPVAAPAPAMAAVAVPTATAREPVVAPTARTFFVQVASLRLMEAADQLSARLRTRGLSAEAVPYGASRGSYWYVVRIGPFATRVGAEVGRLDLDPVDRTSAEVIPRSRGPYHVQVIAAPSQAEAERVIEPLRRRGYRAQITAVAGPGPGRWHCVRLGPFDSRDEADAMRGVLEEREGLKSQVIPTGSSSAGES